MESTTQLQQIADVDESLDVVPQEKTSEVEIAFDHSLRGEGNERLLEVWDQINVESDIAMMTAELLSGAHFFSYAITISNQINDRQGKSRVTFSNDQRKLMEHALDDNLDTFIDRKLNDLFYYIVSTYLLQFQTLPEKKPKKALGMEGRVKSLFIMLFATGNYGIIPKLTVPHYVQDMVNKTFTMIEEEQDNVLDLWISYLEQHEGEEFAELVRSMGRRFWGSEYVTAENSFHTKFQGMTHKFRDLQNTYDAYLRFRGMYLKVTRNLPQNSLFGIFDMTDDKFQNYRRSVINELQVMFTEDENAVAIQKLIYEY